MSGHRPRPRRARIDFEGIAAAALPVLATVAQRWLPDGKRMGCEWVARNPTRIDRTPGSFKINLRSGRWSDFATGAKGGDVISLAAYLFSLTQPEAARKIAAMIGISTDVAQ